MNHGFLWIGDITNLHYLRTKTYCQLLVGPSELSPELEEAKFFLYIASKTKERAAIPKPIQPKTKGMN